MSANGRWDLIRRLKVNKHEVMKDKVSVLKKFKPYVHLNELL